jgi:hypothetical protein
MGSVTGCGRRQLIETNVCLKNRRLVDVRGVIVLGVAGITEPVETTLGELDLSTSRQRFEGSENPRPFATYNWLVGVRAVDGRESNHAVVFP